MVSKGYFPRVTRCNDLHVLGSIINLMFQLDIHKCVVSGIVLALFTNEVLWISTVISLQAMLSCALNSKLLIPKCENIGYL